MATFTQVTLTCDVCGDAKDVETRTIGLDGKTYEIDLCPKDSKGLSKAAAGYVSKARKSGAERSRQHSSLRPRSRAGTAAIDGAIVPGKKKVSSLDSRQEKAKPSRPEPRKAKPGAKRAATVTGAQQKGIYVYGIFPEDIEVAVETPGVGEHPGLMRVVCSGDLAALISEVDLSGRLGSPDDLRLHRETLDAAAAEVPVLPLPFGTVLNSEEAVAEELLSARHDEFAAALAEIDGRAEFVVNGRYVDGSVTSSSADIRVLQEVMAGHCVASVVPEPADEPDAVHVAFLIEAGQEDDVERVIDGLARDWAGRMELELHGPMAAYDFVKTGEPGAGTVPSAAR